MDNSKPLPRSHDPHVDLLRLIASFFVVLIHCSAAGTLWNNLSRFSVPVFVIISGYLLSARAMPLGYYLGKAGKMLATMYICAFLYYLFDAKVLNQEEAFLPYLLTSPYHLWYLYAAAGIYLLSPCLCFFAKQADEALLRYTLVLCFILGCIVTPLTGYNPTGLLAQVFSQTKLPGPLGFVFLYLMGCYIRRFPAPRPFLWLCAGIAASVVAALLTPVGGYTQILSSFFSPAAVITAVALFVLIQAVPMPQSQFLRWAGSCTFGIYLIHPLVIKLLDLWQADISSSLLRCTVVYVLSWAMAGLLRKIPHFPL